MSNVISAVDPQFDPMQIGDLAHIKTPGVISVLPTTFANNGACVPSILSIYSPPRTIGVPI